MQGDSAARVLKECSEMVSANACIDVGYKKRISLVAWAPSSCPRGLLLAARKWPGFPSSENSFP